MDKQTIEARLFAKGLKLIKPHLAGASVPQQRASQEKLCSLKRLPDNLEFRDLPLVIWKEIRTALFCGSVLAVACFGKIMLVDRLLMHNEEVTILVALVVCLTMVLTVMVAKLIGCSLPMIAKKLGFDPAVMASPFITTIVDALSLLVYFGIANALLIR